MRLIIIAIWAVSYSNFPRGKVKIQTLVHKGAYTNSVKFKLWCIKANNTQKVHTSCSVFVKQLEI